MALIEIFNLFKPFIIMVLVLFCVLIIYLYLNQNKMIYVPEVEGLCTNEIKNNSIGMRSPSDISLPYKDVWIKTRDNLRLYGWFIYHKESSYSNLNEGVRTSPTIIYFHENAGNIGFRLPFSEFLYKTLHANILIVGYRGYGYSEGSPSEQGLMLDAEAIIDYVFNRNDTEIADYIDRSNVYIFGRSLGGAVSIYIADKFQPDIKGLILENTFSSMGDMVDKLFPFIKNIKHLLLTNKWPSKDRVKNLKYPILFFSSEHDEIVPSSHMDELYNTAKNAVFKQKYIIKRGTHNESWQKCKEEYLNQIQLFIEKCESLNETIDHVEEDKCNAPSSSINDMTSINREEESYLIEKKTE